MEGADEAQRRKIELLILPTSEAIHALQREAEDANAIPHVTCWRAYLPTRPY
jgi:hypothetical protein